MKKTEIVIRTLVAGAIVVTDVWFMLFLPFVASGAGHGETEIYPALIQNLGRMTLLSFGLAALAYTRRAKIALAGAALYLTLWPLALYALIPGDDLVKLDGSFAAHPRLISFWVGGVFVVRIVIVGLGTLLLKSREQPAGGERRGNMTKLWPEIPCILFARPPSFLVK